MSARSRFENEELRDGHLELVGICQISAGGTYERVGAIIEIDAIRDLVMEHLNTPDLREQHKNLYELFEDGM